MASKSQFQILFSFHWHTSRLMMDQAAKLDDASYHANPGYGHGSIHKLLFHVLRTDYAWRVGLETGLRPGPLQLEDYPSLGALHTGFDEEQQDWTALLEKLTDAEIEADFHLSTARGDHIFLPRWRILQHIILHGMQHHTELAQLLTAKGQSPGDIDFIFFE
jgi:uncharacterized damage-inducible protein DinB